MAYGNEGAWVHIHSCLSVACVSMMQYLPEYLHILNITISMS